MALLTPHEVLGNSRSRRPSTVPERSAVSGRMTVRQRAGRQAGHQRGVIKTTPSLTLRMLRIAAPWMAIRLDAPIELPRAARRVSVPLLVLTAAVRPARKVSAHPTTGAARYVSQLLQRKSPQQTIGCPFAPPLMHPQSDARRSPLFEAKFGRNQDKHASLPNDSACADFPNALAYVACMVFVPPLTLEA